MVVDGLPTYYGYFWNPISSFSSIYPIITLDKITANKMLVVSLMQLAPGSPAIADPRNNSRLLTRLAADKNLRTK